MSDTPRTDTVCIKDHGDSQAAREVIAELARQLKRELAESIERGAELVADCEAWKRTAVAEMIRALKGNDAPQEAKVKDATSAEASVGAAPLGASPPARASCEIGVISADPITTMEQLEATYQAACRGRHITEIPLVLALRNLGIAALSSSSFDALAEAVKAYDAAIHASANDPEKMASFCTAQGDDLDTLYFNMVNLANKTGEPLRRREPSAPSRKGS